MKTFAAITEVSFTLVAILFFLAVLFTKGTTFDALNTGLLCLLLAENWRNRQTK